MVLPSTVFYMALDDTTDPDILTTAEVARYAKVGARSVKAWVSKGLIVPSIVTPGGRMRFRRSDVEALLTPSSSQEEAAC